jgi:hypothetical protein
MQRKNSVSVFAPYEISFENIEGQVVKSLHDPAIGHGVGRKQPAHFAGRQMWVAQGRRQSLA